MEKAKFSIKKQFITLALITFALVFIPRTLPSNINQWMMLQWNTTYESGFVYRGLIGSIMEMFHPYLWGKHVFIYGIINTIIYVVFLLILIKMFLIKQQDKNVFLLIAFFIVQPFITQWYMTSTMFQRFDVFLNIFFILSIIAIVKVEQKYIYPLLIVISIICLLIHEGFAVYTVPTLFSFILFKEVLSLKNGVKALWRAIAFYLVPIIISYVLIVAFGKPSISLEEFHGFIQNQIGEVEISSSDVYSIFYMPISEKVTFTMEHYSAEKIINLILTIILMSPSIYVFFVLWKEVFINSEKKLKLFLIFMVMSTFSTVLAFFVAVDIMRWLGYMVFNNVFALIFLCLIDDVYASALTKKVDKMKYLIVFAIILAVILGPTQWMNGFAIIDKLMTVLGNVGMYLPF